MDALDLQLALGRAPRLSAGQLRTALARLGMARLDQARSEHGALSVLIGQPVTCLQAAGLPRAASTALQCPTPALIASDRAWVEREHITLIDALSERYPPLLGRLTDAPPLLYVRGDADCLSLPQVAMVGSRSPTASGRRTARDFAAHLAQAGLVIASGLALGIDAAAHEGALESGGRTIAVLGSGLDRVYPREHAALAERIVAQGALVSEWPPGTAPLKGNFPRRNRIISGLSLGTLVVEAARHSGSLITARLAAEQGREVFAVPGSIHNPLAHGCHALLREGAKLVESAQEVLEELQFIAPLHGLSRGSGSTRQSAGCSGVLDNEYKILLDALGFGPTSIDGLVDRSGLSSQSVASMLLIMELEGMVALQTDGLYIRLPA